MKRILLVLFLLCLSNPVFAVTQWCDHADNQVCYLMDAVEEGEDNETRAS